MPRLSRGSFKAAQVQAGVGWDLARHQYGCYSRECTESSVQLLKSNPPITVAFDGDLECRDYQG
eukprot:6341639-Amphidinium_carterae.1